MNQKLKRTWKNYIKNLLLLPLIKYQTLICRKTTSPNYYLNFIQIKIIQHQNIYKHKNVRSNSLQLILNLKWKITEQDKTLPIMNWPPKVYKTTIEARFIVASKNCSSKPPSDVISKIFKMIFNNVESFHRKRFILHII